MTLPVHSRLSPFASRPSPDARLCARGGFSLIEMIGVLAIMAIIAGAVGPNVLKSIDRAAVSSEVSTASAFGDQVKKYLHDYGAVPTVGAWSTNIATYSSISPTDVLTNKRQMNRVYLLDPASVPTPRALILSSMRLGVALPTAASITTALQFDQIWTTVDGNVPPVSSWAGWSAWAGWQDYLVIERVNFKTEYRTVVLQNKSNVLPTGSPTNVTVSYKVFATSVALPLLTGTITPGNSASLPNLVQDERVMLYTSTGTLDYTYVVTVSGRTFDFTGANWTAP